MTRTIEADCTFHVPARVLYSAFLDSHSLSRMTLSASTVSGIVGGQFSMFNGGVTGKIRELSPTSKITEDWRFSQWPQGEYSLLELTFESLSDHKTRLCVRQSGIPEHDAHGNSRQDELVLNGWKSKFFVGLEKVLGYAVDRD
jgi:activator of HSP90 ATPase